ncbi:hypothetical protein [Ligaoa zhengdingensis]|uniref:hypothetical protein n=1 Tax=Ligaoa zhengdingensis TaxID=2763658 RepID=UPI0031BB9209
MYYHPFDAERAALPNFGRKVRRLFILPPRGSDVNEKARRARIRRIWAGWSDFFTSFSRPSLVITANGLTNLLQSFYLLLLCPLRLFCYDESEPKHQDYNGGEQDES